MSQKLTKEQYLQRAKDYATSRGGQCLSNECRTVSTRLLFKCGLLHEWSTTFKNAIQNSQWCRKCSALNSRITIQECHELAISKGGECLSKEYLNESLKIEWKCHNAQHKSWFANANDIKKGTWCCKCAFEKIAKLKTLANGLELAQKKAEIKGGLCLSTEYINNSTKMKWKCGINTHPEWFATYNTINKGSWCPSCAIGTPDEAIKICKQYAQEKGGLFLSGKYKNRYTKMQWKCNNPNHLAWYSTMETIVMKKSWCPECAGFERPEVIIEKAKIAAALKNGECLSTICKNKSEKLLWKCSIKTHNPFLSKLNHVLQNRWCPSCANISFYQENKIRNVLNYLLDTKFIKVSPSWNINPYTNRKLELDGFCNKLKIAFEFQGIHHQKEISRFGVNKEKLNYIKLKDAIKIENCKKNGVKLLIINEILDGSANDMNYFNLILNELTKNDINVNKEINMIEVDKAFRIMTDFQVSSLLKAYEYAKSLGGECLSKEYLNYQTKLEWKCHNPNHPSWFRNMTLIAGKNWCKLCSYKK